MKKTFLFLLTIGCMLSCNTEKTTDYQKMILGKWKFVDATRDGQPAPTLEGIQYEFTADGKIKSNLGGNGFMSDYSYSIADDTIKQRNGKMDIDFIISKVLKDSLFLSAHISSFDFEIVLERDKSK